MKFNLNSISYKDLKTCRYLLRFSYIGTNYTGLQRQTNREDIDEGIDCSVQYQIENAIEKQLRPIYGARLAISSRTDSGVHAVVNSGHIDLTHPYINTVYKPSFITDSVNKYLYKRGQQIRILNTQRVGNGFNARNEAKWRSYLYRLAVVESVNDISIGLLDSLIPISELNRYHVIIGPVDIQAIEDLVNLFKGCHDFASFTPKPIPFGDKQTVKDSVKTIIELNFNQTNNIYKNAENSDKNDLKIDLLTFEIKSKSFLYNQVRRMIDSIIDVGLQRFPLKHMEWLLKSPSHKNWSQHQTVAPSNGLWLKNIYYDPKDLQLFDDSGNQLNSVPNDYPNYDQISHFHQ